MSFLFSFFFLAVIGITNSYYLGICATYHIEDNYYVLHFDLDKILIIEIICM